MRLSISKCRQYSAKGVKFTLGTAVPLHAMYAMKIHAKNDLHADLPFQIFKMYLFLSLWEI